MRVVIPTIYPTAENAPKGGVESAAQALAINLSRLEDLDVHVVAPSNCHANFIEVRGKVTIHWLPQPRIFGFLHYYTSYKYRMHRYALSLGADIVHFQGLAGWCIDFPEPYVLTIHGIPEADVLYSAKGMRRIRSKVIEYYENKGRSESKYTIIINEYVKEALGNTLHGALLEIENPVSVDVLHLKLESKMPNILFAGRIGPRKNIHGLLEAFNIIFKSHKYATLTLAGLVESPKYFADCLQYINKNRLEDAVKYVGNLDRSALLKRIATSTCLALLSFQETAPMIIAEAQCAGLPVVASNTCGNAHMIEDGVTGYLVNPCAPQEAATRIIELLNNDLTWNTISNNAKSIAVRTYSPESIAARTLHVYNAVLSAQSSLEAP